MYSKKYAINYKGKQNGKMLIEISDYAQMKKYQYRIDEGLIKKIVNLIMQEIIICIGSDRDE